MWQNLWDTISMFRLRDVIDILIVAYVLYRFLVLIKETRAAQVLKGLAVLLIATKVTEWLKLNTINWLLSNAMTVGVIALLIVFQPELRRALEHIGRGRFFNSAIFMPDEKKFTKVINEITQTVQNLARNKIGALIVIERKTGISDVVETGVRINGTVSSELLFNIFAPNTPLHDGAVIIREDQILAAGCFLPLTENPNLSKQLGTRHRAGLGISEVSDAISIIVSEETGIVSLAKDGKLTRYLDAKGLRDILNDIFGKNVESNPLKIRRWRIKNDRHVKK
ncbi:MAG TPA: TIGR00159 family protein [Clostridiales bacterium]|nr:TIGR00159 family protein [Clostridiales bacterium]